MRSDSSLGDASGIFQVIQACTCVVQHSGPQHLPSRFKSSDDHPFGPALIFVTVLGAGLCLLLAMASRNMVANNVVVGLLLWVLCNYKVKFGCMSFSRDALWLPYRREQSLLKAVLQQATEIKAIFAHADVVSAGVGWG